MKNYEIQREIFLEADNDAIEEICRTITVHDIVQVAKLCSPGPFKTLLLCIASRLNATNKDDTSDPEIIPPSKPRKRCANQKRKAWMLRVPMRINGKIVDCGPDQATLLGNVFARLEEIVPGFLDAWSKLLLQTTTNGRVILAKNPNLLERSETARGQRRRVPGHPDWWFGHCYNVKDKARRIQQACEFAGVKFVLFQQI